MTRSEAIEAAARALLTHAEPLAYECVDGEGTNNRTLERCATSIAALRAALALPPDAPHDGTRETECIRALLGRLEREGIENDAVREARAILGITA